MNSASGIQSPFGKDQVAWIFDSHLHRDLEKVRQIRNELERHGHYSRAETQRKKL